MAKQRLDEFDWDSSLDFEIDDPFAPSSTKEKRGVVSRVTSNLTKGFKSAFTDPSSIRKIVENTLPSGYGKAFDFKDKIQREAEEIHSIAQKELAPALPAMRRITQQHLGNARRFLPKKVADKLEEFSKQSPYYRSQTQEERNEEELKSAMAEVFGVQMEADARRGAEERLERGVQHAQNLRMSRAQVQSLNVMQQGIMRLVTYQDEITNKFQRRSIELQTRHYMVARDSLKLQAETASRFNAFFEALVKNTSMPDIAKQDLHHSAKDTFRKKLFGGIHHSAGRLAQDTIGRISKKIQSRVKEGLGGLSSALGMSDGMDVGGASFLDMGLEFAGKFATQKATSYAAKKLLEQINKRHPGFKKWLEEQGFGIELTVESLPFLLNEYARSPTRRAGFKGDLERGIKSFIGGAKIDLAVAQHGMDDLATPATFDRIAHRSLIEIIPGLLSRIEHNTARALDPTAKRQAYSHVDRKFMDEDKAAGNAMHQIFNRSNAATAKRQVTEFVDHLLDGFEVSNKARDELIKQIIYDSADGRGRILNYKQMMSPSEETKYISAETKLELSPIFNQLDSRDKKWKSESFKSYAAMDLGQYLPRSQADAFRDIGQRDLMVKAGILKRDGDFDVIDFDKFANHIFNANLSDEKVKESSWADRLMGQLSSTRLGEKFGGNKNHTDLFITPGGAAVLLWSKLQQGIYLDRKTKKTIYSWDQIRGEIEDVSTGMIAADIPTLIGGLYDKSGKLVRFSVDAGRTSETNANPFVPPVNNVSPSTPRPRAGQDIEDVINASGVTVMTGWQIRAGEYRDQLTGDPIDSLNDIKGPVIDRTGQVVVSAKDVADILRTKSGRELSGALERMRSNARLTASQIQSSALPPPLPPSYGNTDTDNVQPAFAGDSVQFGTLTEINAQQLEVLKIIAEILANQEGGGGFKGGYLDRLALFGIKGIFGGAKAVGKATWGWTKFVGKTLGSGVGSIFNAAGAIGSGVTSRVGNLVRGIRDVYVQGKRKPVLLAEKLKMGHYKDENSGKTVQRWRDITGPVTDKTTGETVLDREDFDAGIYVKGPTGLIRLATKSVKNLFGAAVSFYGGVAALPFKVAGWGLKAVGEVGKWLFNKQVDVYVKGESEPRLKAGKMKRGLYYNAGGKKNGKRVRTYEDIYGEIRELPSASAKASMTDEVVLYEDEIPNIVSRFGMKLGTPFSKLVGAVGGLGLGLVKGAGALFGGALKGYGKLFGGLMGAGGAMLGAPFKFLGALLNPFEKHGAKQVEWLEKIHNLLDKRLADKKPRKGSWQEQFAKKEAAEKEKQDKEEKREQDKKWGVGGLLSFFKNKGKGLFGFGRNDDDEEDEEDDGFGLDDAADAAMVLDAANGLRRKKHGPAKTGGRINRWRRNRAAKALRAARAAKTAGKAGKVGRLARVASRFKPRGASVGGVLGGLAAGAALTYGGAKAAEYVGEDTVGGKALEYGGYLGTASILSGLVGGPTIGSVLGGAAAAAGGILGAPVLIGAAALAAGGAMIYYGYKQHKYGKLNPIRRLRYMQYGVDSGDAGNNKKIFDLEDLLINHVSDEGGHLEIVGKSQTGGKDITMKDVYELMDMEDGWFSKKSEQRAVFNQWYSRRFKPIFLTWVREVRGLEPSMSLLDADEKLSKDKVEKLLPAVWKIDRSLYLIPAGPFEGVPALTDVSKIEDAYNFAMKENGKSDSEKTYDKVKSWGMKLNSFIPGYGQLANYFTNKLDERRAEKEGAEASAKQLEEKTGTKLEAMSGKIQNTKAADGLLSGAMVRLEKLTPLQSIRFRTYGLSELNIDRCRALASLESIVFNRYSLGSAGNLVVTMNPEQVYASVAGLFGLTANNPGSRNRWMQWYFKRFLPVVSAYIKAVKAIGGTAALDAPESTMKAAQLVEVAQAVMNAKDPDGNSVWNYRLSPWREDETLNSDSNALAGSLLLLKNKADKEGNSIAKEEKVPGEAAAVDVNKGMLTSMMDSMKSGAKAVKDWLVGGWESAKSWVSGKMDAVSGFVKSSWDWVKSSASGATAAVTGVAAGVTAAVIKGLSQFAQKAADYATTAAGTVSVGRCARFVADALSKAGYKFDRQVSAYMYASLGILAGMGFKELPATAEPVKGDVMVFGQTDKHPHGHIQIFNGSQWVSDFVQRNMIPYRDVASAGAITLWRHFADGKGTEPTPGDGTAKEEKPDTSDPKAKDREQTLAEKLLGTDGNRTTLGKVVDFRNSALRGVQAFGSEVGRRAASGYQAMRDNATGMFDGMRRGSLYDTASNAVGAATAMARHMVGVGVPKPLQINGSAKDRERILLEEAIKAGITDPQELAMLLGQVAAETGGFSQVEENLKYRPETLMKLWPNRFPTLFAAQQALAGGIVAFADMIYNGRMGNRAPGDGYKYRGRGLMQLTGKANYEAFARATGLDVVNNPDLVATDPRVAALSAIHYWNTRVKGRANLGDLNSVTRAINGGLNGLEHRRSYVGQYMQRFANKSLAEIQAAFGGKPVGPTEKANFSDVTSSVASSSPVTAAPDLSSTRTLDAAAAAQRTNDQQRAVAEQQVQQQKEQQQRIVETQSQYQSQVERQQMGQTNQLLTQQLEVQKAIAANTSDTVSLLREILRKGSQVGTEEKSASAEPSHARRSITRSFDSNPTPAPVSVRFSG